MLVIDDLTLRIAGRSLLEGASAQVPDGARVGLIGRNGTGKSTLFRAIAGDIAPEHGSIQLPTRARIGRLPQEAPAGPERLIDLVLAADRERSALMAEAEAAHDPHRIAEIQTRLADIGAPAAPAPAPRLPPRAARRGPPRRPGPRRRHPRRPRIRARRPAARRARLLRRLAHAGRAR